MTETPRRPGIRGALVTPPSASPAEDPDKTEEILLEEILAAARRQHRPALRRAVDRTSAAIQRQDGRKLVLALITMVAALAVAIMFPLAGFLTRAGCVAVAIALIFVWLRVVRGSASDAQHRADELLRSPIEASKRARLAMGKNETLYYEHREHSIVLTPLFLGYAIIMFVIVVYIPDAAKAWSGLAVTLVASFLLLRWQRRHVCVSKYRVFLLDGIISRDVKEMPLAKMTDRSQNASPLSVVLAWLRIIDRPFGRVEFESAGQDQAVRVIHALPDSEALSRWIVTVLMPEQKEDDGT